jgi:hypothetical protein
MSTLALSNQLFFLQCLFVQLAALFSTLQAFLQSAKFVGAANSTQRKRISIFNALFCCNPNCPSQGVKSKQQAPASNVNSMPISLFDSLFAATTFNCSQEPYRQVRSIHSISVPISLFDAIFAVSTSNNLQESFLQLRSNCFTLKAVPWHPPSPLPPFASPHMPDVPTTDARDFASPQAHAEGPTTDGDVFVGPQAHTEGSRTAAGDVFVCSQAHTESPLTATENLIVCSGSLTAAGEVFVCSQEHVECELAVTENVLACSQAHTEGPLTTGGHVFAVSQAHTEGPITTTEDVFVGSQAHTEGPLTTVGHVFIDLQTGSCVNDLVQPAGSDPSHSRLPASKVPVSLAALPALCVPTVGSLSMCPTTHDNRARSTLPLSVLSFPYFGPEPDTPFLFPPASAKSPVELMSSSCDALGLFSYAAKNDADVDSSHEDVEARSADILPTKVIIRQPCEVTFATLAAKDLTKASMTCRQSFVALRPALRLREHLLFPCPPLIKETVLDAEDLGVSRLHHTANCNFVNACLSPRSCEATFSFLATKDLTKASMTCRKSFVALRPALKLQEHLQIPCSPSVKDTVSQNEAYHASRSYLAEALLGRFSSQDLSAPCSFSFLPLSTLVTLASASLNIFAVSHPAVRFRRAQREVEPVLLRNNIAARMFSKGAVYYCTLCQANFLSQALCSVCECMFCRVCDGTQSRFTQFFNSSTRCVCVGSV